MLAVDAIAPEAVVTFDRIEGFEVVASFGDVCGEAILPRSFFRTTVRTLGSLIGFGAGEILTDAERARARALANLLESGHALGANAIVKLRFDAVEESDGSTRVTAYGEALTLSPTPGSAQRAPR